MTRAVKIKFQSSQSDRRRFYQTELGRNVHYEATSNRGKERRKMANRISLLARNLSIDSPNAAKRMEDFVHVKRFRILGRD